MPIEFASAKWLKTLVTFFVDKGLAWNDTGDGSVVLQCTYVNVEESAFQEWRDELSLLDPQLKQLCPNRTLPERITVATMAIGIATRLKNIDPRSLTVQDFVEKVVQDTAVMEKFKHIQKILNTQEVIKVLIDFHNGFTYLHMLCQRVDAKLHDFFQNVDSYEVSTKTLENKVSLWYKSDQGKGTGKKEIQKSLEELSAIQHSINKLFWESSIKSHKSFLPAKGAVENDAFASFCMFNLTILGREDFQKLKIILSDPSVVNKRFRLDENEALGHEAMDFFLYLENLRSKVTKMAVDVDKHYASWMAEQPKNTDPPGVGDRRMSSLNQRLALDRDEIHDEVFASNSREDTLNLDDDDDQPRSQGENGPNGIDDDDILYDNPYGASGGPSGDPDGDPPDDHGSDGGDYPRRRPPGGPGRGPPGGQGDHANAGKPNVADRIKVIKEKAKAFILESKSILSDPNSINQWDVDYLYSQGKSLDSTIDKIESDNAIVIKLFNAAGVPVVLKYRVGLQIRKLKQALNRLDDVKHHTREYDKDKKSLLGRDGYQIPKLTSIENILPWLSAVKNILEVSSPSTQRLATEKVKSSLLDSDLKAVQFVTNLDDLLRVIHTRYQGNSNVFRNTIENLFKLAQPPTNNVVLSNWRKIEQCFKDLIDYGMQHLVTSYDISQIEKKVFSGIHMTEYKYTKSKFTRSSPENQTRFLEGDSNALELFQSTKDNPLLMSKEQLDKRNEKSSSLRQSEKTYASLVDSFVRSEDNTSNEKIRLFFSLQATLYVNRIKDEFAEMQLQRNIQGNPYSPKKFRKFPPKKSQDSGGEIPSKSHTLFVSDPPPAQNLSQVPQGKSSPNHGLSFGNHQRNNFGGAKQKWNGNKSFGNASKNFESGKNQQKGNNFKQGDRKNFNQNKTPPPQKPCPFNCSQKYHAYGSGNGCKYFKEKPLSVRLALVSKLKLLTKCCLKTNGHDSSIPCPWSSCTHCGSKFHASLLCTSPKAKHHALLVVQENPENHDVFSDQQDADQDQDMIDYFRAMDEEDFPDIENIDLEDAPGDEVNPALSEEEDEYNFEERNDVYLERDEDDLNEYGNPFQHLLMVRVLENPPPEIPSFDDIMNEDQDPIMPPPDFMDDAEEELVNMLESDTIQQLADSSPAALLNFINNNNVSHIMTANPVEDVDDIIRDNQNVAAVGNHEDDKEQENILDEMTSLIERITSGEERGIGDIVDEHLHQLREDEKRKEEEKVALHKNNDDGQKFASKDVHSGGKVPTNEASKKLTPGGKVTPKHVHKPIGRGYKALYEDDDDAVGKGAVAPGAAATKSPEVGARKVRKINIQKKRKLEPSEQQKDQKEDHGDASEAVHVGALNDADLSDKQVNINNLISLLKNQDQKQVMTTKDLRQILISAVIDDHDCDDGKDEKAQEAVTAGPNPRHSKPGNMNHPGYGAEIKSQVNNDTLKNTSVNLGLSKNDTESSDDDYDPDPAVKPKHRIIQDQISQKPWGSTHSGTIRSPLATNKPIDQDICTKKGFIDIHGFKLSLIPEEDYKTIKAMGTMLRSLQPIARSHTFDSWLQLPKNRILDAKLKKSHNLVYMGGFWWFRARCLYDSGSLATIAKKEIFNIFATASNGEPTLIQGLSGEIEKVRPGFMVLRGISGQEYKILVHKSNLQVSDASIDTNEMSNMVKILFNTTSNIFNKQSREVDLLIGNLNSSIAPIPLDAQKLATLGFRYPIESPDLTMFSCGISCEGLFVSGGFGMVSELAEDSLYRVKVPDCRSKSFSILDPEIVRPETLGRMSSLLRPYQLVTRRNRIFRTSTKTPHELMPPCPTPGTSTGTKLKVIKPKKTVTNQVLESIKKVEVGKNAKNPFSNTKVVSLLKTRALPATVNQSRPPKIVHLNSDAAKLIISRIENPDQASPGITNDFPHTLSITPVSTANQHQNMFSNKERISVGSVGGDNADVNTTVGSSSIAPDLRQRYLEWKAAGAIGPLPVYRPDQGGGSPHVQHSMMISVIDYKTHQPKARYDNNKKDTFDLASGSSSIDSKKVIESQPPWRASESSSVHTKQTSLKMHQHQLNSDQMTTMHFLPVSLVLNIVDPKWTPSSLDVVSQTKDDLHVLCAQNQTNSMSFPLQPRSLKTGGKVKNYLNVFNLLKTADEKDERNLDLLIELLIKESKMRLEPSICFSHLQETFSCHNCFQADSMSIEDLELHKKIKNSMEVVPITEKNSKAKYYFRFNYVISGDPWNIFDPSNSNREEAIKNCDTILRKLLRMGVDKLKAYHETFLESIQMGFMSQLTPDEERNLTNTPHHFLPHNFVENIHSATSPLRRICDTSRVIKGKFTTHSSVISSPQGSLNSLVSCQLNYSFHECHFGLDIKKAYKKLRLTEESKMLCLSVWFADPFKPNPTHTLYKDNVVGFGIGQASSQLELAVSEVSKHIKRPSAKQTVVRLTMADDIKDSRSCPLQMQADIDEIQLKMQMFDLEMKPAQTNAFLIKGLRDLDEKPEWISDSFGTFQDHARSLMWPSTYLSPFASKRGIPGTPLDDVDVFSLVLIISLRVITRIVASLYDITGSQLGPLIASAKRHLSRIYTTHPGIGWDVNLYQIDPELDNSLRIFLHSLKGLNKKLLPFCNFVVPYRYNFNHLVVSRDGSQSGSSVVIHVISRKTKEAQSGPPFFTYILWSKDTVQSASVPCQEATAIRMSIEAISTIMKALYSKLEEGNETVNVFSIGDARALTYHFSNQMIIKNISIRNRIYFSKLLCQNLTIQFPKLRIFLGWKEGKYLVADYNSKLMPNPIEIANSKVWRHAYPYYVNQRQLQKNVFYISYQGTEKYIPIDLQTIKDDQVELAKFNVFNVPFTKKTKNPTPLLTLWPEKSDRNFDQTKNDKTRQTSKNDKQNRQTSNIFQGFSNDKDIQNQHIALLNGSDQLFQLHSCHVDNFSISTASSLNSALCQRIYVRHQEAVQSNRDALLAVLMIRTRARARQDAKEDIQQHEQLMRKERLRVQAPETFESMVDVNKSGVRDDVVSRYMNEVSTPQDATLSQHSQGSQHEAVNMETDFEPMQFPSNDIKLSLASFHQDKISHLLDMVNTIESTYNSPVKGLLDPIYISNYQGLLFSGKDYIKFLFRYSNFRRTVRVGFFLLLSIFTWKFKTRRSKNEIHLAQGLKNGVENRFVCFKPAKSVKWHILDHYTVLLELWIQLLRMDQKYFPLTKPNSTEIRIITKTGIVGRECRMAPSEKLRVFATKFQPLLAQQSPLLHCLIWFAHLSKNPQHPILGLHLNHSTTENRLKKYLFSVTGINIGIVLTTFMRNCPGCLRTVPNHFSTVQGRNLMTLNYNILQFTQISIDPLGKVLCKITEQGDTLIHLTPLVVCCLVTGAMIVIPMTGGTRHQVQIALEWLMIRTGAKINLVVADHATIFKNLSHILPGVKLRVCHARSQHSNRVERSIKSFKEIWRRMFRITSKEPGRNLRIPTWSELCLRIDLATSVVNQTPYHPKGAGRDVSPAICPDFFKNPGIYCLLSKEEFRRNKEELHFTLAAKIKEFIKGCVAARNDSLVQEEARFVGKQKVGLITPKEGDICFVKSENNHERARLCQILELTTTSAKIKFVDGRTAFWSLKNLHPLSCFRNEKIFSFNPCSDSDS